MALGVKAKIEGVDDLLSRLNGLERKIAKKIVRKAVNEGTKTLLKEAKSKVPVATRLLKKSLGRKVKVYRNSGITVGIVGPRKGFKKQIGTKPRKGFLGRLFRLRVPKYQDPVKYAHLVERGTKKAKAQPFIEPSLTANQSRINQETRRIILEGIEQEARR